MRGRLALLVLVGCTTPARPHLVDVGDAAADECPDGGLVIRTGTDDNGNGHLDDAEVDGRELVCSGTGGHAALADTAAEPPGANCVRGGTRVRSGLDRDDDGVLDDDEVDRVVYVCDPPDGVSTVATTRAEPPGPNCAEGGVAIESGPDLDGDGTLDPEEIAGTQYLCNGTMLHPDTVVGNVTVATALDLALLASVTRITGSLTIDPIAGVAQISLPKLERVDGAVRVRGAIATTVELPVLSSVASLALDHASALATVALPELAAVEGTVAITSAPQLAQLAVPRLATIGGAMTMTDATALAQLAVPQLATIGGDTAITNATALAAIAAPNLVAIAGDLTIDGAPALAQVDIHALTSAGVVLRGTPVLAQTEFHADALAHAGHVLLGRPLPWTSLAPLAHLVDAVSIGVDLSSLASADLPELVSVEAFSCCSSVPGATPVSLDGFGKLATAGTILIQGTNVVSLHGFGALHTASSIGLTGTGLVHLDAFPALVEVTDVSIGSNAALVDATPFPALETLRDLTVSNNLHLQHFRAPDGVITARNVSFDGNQQLVQLDGFGALATVAGLRIDLGQMLDIPVLAHLASVSSLTISDQIRLRAVRMPLLTDLGSFSLHDADEVDALAMPALTSVGNFSLFHLAKLPRCQVADLFAQTQFTGPVPAELPACQVIDACQLEAPGDVVLAAGAPFAAVGRVRILGVTDATPGIDANVVLRAAVGTGDAGTDPRSDPSWSFTDASPRAGWNDAPAPGFDEYLATLTAVTGTHDVAARFSGDGGRTWTTCANVGHVEVP